MLPLKRVRNINRYDKHTVFGYIKRIQKLMKKKQIPLVIDQLCLLFYYEFDQFHPKSSIHPPRIIGMMDIVNNEYSRKFLYQWRFKYEALPCQFNPLWIGITKTSDTYPQCNIAIERNGKLYSGCNLKRMPQEIEMTANLTKWHNSKKEILSCDEIILSIDIKAAKMEFVIQRGGAYYFYPPLSIYFSKDQKYRVFTDYWFKDINVKLIAFNKIVRTSTRNDNELIRDQIRRIEIDELKQVNNAIIKFV